MELLKTKIISFLRYTERYTKTDMVYLASGGFWLTVGQIISSASALTTSIAFANLISPDTFGVYKYIISVTSLLTISTLSGMDSAVTRSVSMGFEGSVDSGRKVKTKWGIIGSVTSLVVAIYYFIQANNILAISFGIVAIFIPLVESFDIYNSLLFGKKKFDVQTKYNIIKKMISLLGVVLALLVTKNIYIIISVYFISLIVPNFIFFYKTKKYYQSNTDIDSGTISYGKSLSVAQVMGLIAAELDKIMVFQFIGAAELAIYSFALAPTEQIKGFTKNLNSLAMPKFSKKGASEIKNNIKNKILILGVTTIILVFIYIIIAPLFFKILFPQYLDSIIYSQVLSISIIGAVLSSFLYTILESQKAEKEIYNFNIYGNIFNIVTMFPLIFYYGIWGIIISRIMSRFFIMFYTAYLVKNIK